MSPGAAGEPGESASDVWVAFSTAPDLQGAEELGRRAVEAGHAACVNLISGVRSLYRWQGALEEAHEVLMVFKTTRTAFPRLAELVSAVHRYEVPELIAFPLADGLPAYLAWVRAVSAPVDTRDLTV